VSERKWIPIVELKGIPARTLRRWCEKGKVRARKKKGHWQVQLAELLEAKRQDAGL
jgi:predicted site-specific integrase-resolvase